MKIISKNMISFIVALNLTTLFSYVMQIKSLPSSLSDDIDLSYCLRFDVKYKMVEHKIIPTAVPIAPKMTCHVKFDWGEPEPGQNLQQFSNNVAQPAVFWDAKNNSLYSMMSFGVTDWFDVRDAPEQERNYTLHEWIEWIVFNIPGQNVSEGRVLYDYEPSPPHIGKNVTYLIIYLVYQQNGTINIPLPTGISWSEYTDRGTAARFAERYKLGNPVAGNFYYVSYDQENVIYEPVIHTSIQI